MVKKSYKTSGTTESNQTIRWGFCNTTITQQILEHYLKQRKKN